MNLTIRRKKWLRGTKTSVLRNENGSMCCLGFYARKCNIPASKLVGLGEPFELVEMGLKALPGLFDKFGASTKLCTQLISENDERGIELGERENRIKSLFKKIGVNVKFTD